MKSYLRIDPGDIEAREILKYFGVPPKVITRLLLPFNHQNLLDTFQQICDRIKYLGILASIGERESMVRSIASLIPTELSDTIESSPDCSGRPNIPLSNFREGYHLPQTIEQACLSSTSFTVDVHPVGEVPLVVKSSLPKGSTSEPADTRTIVQKMGQGVEEALRVSARIRNMVGDLNEKLTASGIKIQLVHEDFIENAFGIIYLSMSFYMSDRHINIVASVGEDFFSHMRYVLLKIGKLVTDYILKH